MISKYLSRLKFQLKIRFSFNSLMFLMLINTIVGCIAVYSIISQITQHKKIEQVIRAVTETNLSVHHFSHTASRDDIKKVNSLINSIEQQLKLFRIGFEKIQSNKELLQELTNFKNDFQKYILQRDQTKALENRSIYLEKNLISTINNIFSNNSNQLTNNELNNIVTQILDIHWQGEEIKHISNNQLINNLQNSIDRLIKYGEENRFKQRNIETQRAFFLIRRDTRDYASALNKYIQNELEMSKTEQKLFVISAHMYQLCLTFENDIRNNMKWQIISAALMMILISVASFVAAKYLASFLFIQITNPISELLNMTRKISEGDRTVRASEGLDDEIGQLAHSFNIMTDHLQQTEQELRLHNQNLEQRVLERTKELEESNRKLESLSITDGLTKLANRRHFDEVLLKEYSRHIRNGTKLSLIMLDIDHFKAFNDTYGHLNGDDCLRQVGRVIAESVCRITDLPARYGGEEFACILTETNIDGAIIIAEQIRRAIEALAIPHTGSTVAKYVTASLGVVTGECTQDKSALDMLSQTDELLYRAKASGRNRVEFIANDPLPSIINQNLSKSFVHLVWKDIFCCGEPLIDEQHQALFYDANKLFDAILTSSPASDISPIITNLIVHAQEHFHDEQKILAKIAFPNIEQHIAEHDKLLIKAQELSQKFNISDISIADLFQFMVNDVVLIHLLGADREYLPYLQNIEKNFEEVEKIDS